MESLIKAHLFGGGWGVWLWSHIVDDSSAQGGEKEIYSVGEDNSNMCKNVVIEMEFMQSHVEIALHEDVELQSELWHALDILIDEHENVEMPCQFNAKTIVAYLEVGESRIFLKYSC